jgi:hypothetical protein
VFTAGTVAGAYTVTATLTGVAQPANFSLTNTAGAANAISVSSGSPQFAVFSTAFTLPLVALVVDADSNPVEGVSVVFLAPAAGASGTFVNGTATETDTTDVNGLATSSTFTANATTGGPYMVSATAAGVAVPAEFSLTNATGGTVVTVTPGAGTTPQNAAISTAFAVPLAVLVQTGGIPTSGVSVTFTAPATGASGTFASNSTATETDVTGANGVATASAFTANASTGGYMVSATYSGVTADFNLTNTPSGTSNNYSFYLTGLEVSNQQASPVGPNFYALAGSATIAADGTVTAGEQDYNDAFGNTSPGDLNTPPVADTITSGTLAVDPTTGLGTLTLVTNNPTVGVAGTEILGVQFVNASHALIVQYDGSATSSGSLDLQNLTAGAPSGPYAFALSGVDSSYAPVVSGGVFTITGTALNGAVDINDGVNGLGTGLSLIGTVSAPDSFGRGTITGTTVAPTLSYYIVGPEVMRIIDVDATDSMVGSAFGQGASAGTFGNTSLGTSVFGIQSNSWADSYAAAGMFTTTPGTGTFLGVGDDNELAVGPIPASAISGTYGVSANGYGAFAITLGDLGDVSALGMYMTDPALNLLDPNNTAGGGGALIVDLDPDLFGTGVLIPQADNATADFAGNYAFGAQDFNENDFWEFDLVGQGSVTAGATNVLAGNANVSDPGGFFDGDVSETIGATVAATATPDPANLGRYTIPTLAVTVTGGTEVDLSATIYQASGPTTGGQLFWLGTDATDVFLGSIELQGSLTGVPGVKKAPAKTTKKRTK